MLSTFKGWDTDWATARGVARTIQYVLHHLSALLRSIRQIHIQRIQTGRLRKLPCISETNSGRTGDYRSQVVSPQSSDLELRRNRVCVSSHRTQDQRPYSLTFDALDTTSVRLKVSDLRMGIWRPYWNGPNPFTQTATDSGSKHDLLPEPKLTHGFY